MTETPWLYDTVTVTTHPVPVTWDWSVYLPGDPMPDDEDPEDDWTEEE